MQAKLAVGPGPLQAGAGWLGGLTGHTRAAAGRMRNAVLDSMLRVWCGEVDRGKACGSGFERCSSWKDVRCLKAGEHEVNRQYACILH